MFYSASSSNGLQTHSGDWLMASTLDDASRSAVIKCGKRLFNQSHMRVSFSGFPPVFFPGDSVISVPQIDEVPSRNTVLILSVKFIIWREIEASFVVDVQFPAVFWEPYIIRLMWPSETEMEHLRIARSYCFRGTPWCVTWTLIICNSFSPGRHVSLCVWAPLYFITVEVK